MNTKPLIAIALLSTFICVHPRFASAQDKPIRIGIIGCDTSHVPAFAKLFNDPKAEGDLAGFKVVAAFPGGSPDIQSSHSRVAGFVKQLQDMGVEIVDTVPKLVEKVDVVLLESVDGRPHLAQARPVIEAKKRLFIDKPLAGSLADAIAIADLAKKHDVPWFSSSALRFEPGIVGLRNNEKVGDIIGADAFGPCPVEATHPDLFWYGVHGVEALYAVMGSGCVSVTRVRTEGAELVTGVWKNGRIGTFRGIREGKAEYGVVAFGEKGVATHMGFAGYKPLVVEIARFFKTGKPPVTPEETIEMFAFMEAADQSKRDGGKAVNIDETMTKARGAKAP